MASCDIRQAQRELYKMPVTCMTCNWVWPVWRIIFSIGNITLGKQTWNGLGWCGSKTFMLNFWDKCFFAYIKGICIWVILDTCLSLAGGVSVPYRAYLYLTSWVGSVLLGPGICLSICTTCTRTSDGWGWKYLWQLKCFAWKLFWGFFEVRIFRLQGVNSPSKRFCFLIAANDCGAIKHSPLCSCF